MSSTTRASPVSPVMGVALWWLGLSSVVLASALLVIGKVGLMAAVVCVYWIVATARNACGRAADRHADWLREDARLHHEVHGRGDV